jgi:membrane protein implicated in regulation of membrane protease activity
VSRHMWFGIGGVIVGLILFAILPWWVPVLVIAAAIAIPVTAWAMLGSSNRRRIGQMRRRGQLGP